VGASPLVHLKAGGVVVGAQATRLVDLQL